MRHEILKNDCRFRLLQGAVRRGRQALSRSCTRLKRTRRGAVALFVALGIIPLITFVGLAVDTTRGYLVKSRLNQALDAAALAGGRVFDSASRDADIQMYFKANFPDGFMNAVTTPLVITPDNANKILTVTANATMPTSFMHLVNIDTIDVSATAQVQIGASNIEVALVLDITQSMNTNNKIGDLKIAANQLIDIVVQDQQTPYYTKIALAPFSYAVNVGSYAPDIRGPIANYADITGVQKLGTTSATRKIKVLAPGHPFNNGDKVFITTVSGITHINNSTSGAYNSTNQPTFWTVGNKTVDDFILKKADGTDINNWNSSPAWGNYSSGGKIFCTVPGCQYQAFQDDSSSHVWRVHQVTSCVTERIGANVNTDVAPSTTYIGRHYPASASECNANVITPLSSDKPGLHAKINALATSGSTAGHIGIAWGWNLVSPNFSYLWPTASEKPAAYGTPKLMKVVVIMTDGDFNTAYYNGVQSQNYSIASSSARANNNANNGSPYTQAQALCANMKAPGKDVIVYTVGLGLDTQAAIDLMNQCATSPSHVYLPADGSELQDAFNDIAQKISKLRLTK